VADEPETAVPDEGAPDVAAAGEGTADAENAAVTAAATRAEVERNKRVRRNLLLLSLANWAVAIIAWSLSAYLGVASPASIMVYTILFLIGLFAALVAFAAYVLERFAHRPELSAPEAVDVDEPGIAAGPPA
jgi:uncharacterized membrane protein